MDGQILTVAEAADRLKIPRSGIRRLIRNGSIRATRLGNGRPGYRILSSEIDRLVGGEHRGTSSGQR